MVTPEPVWLASAKRLGAIASTGLHYARDPFDRERYAEVAVIADRLLASLASVPVERIRDLVPDFARGYATPRVDVRGAVVENGRVLLVRERSDGLWALPGGFADVGRSAAENVIKEVEEEAGLRVRAARLYGVRHKAAASYAPDVRDFYKLFFLCEQRGERDPCPGGETSEAAFFAPSALPPLSRGRTVGADVEAAVAYAADPARPTFFD